MVDKLSPVVPLRTDFPDVDPLEWDDEDEE